MEEAPLLSEAVIAHFGVKGMKWGVRKDSEVLGVPPKTARAAKSDAEEFTKAKMFYGDGAGTRRKLINAKVNQRMSDPNYKKAFDHYVSKTDLAKRSDQAKSTRRRKDAVNSTKKTARGVKNTILNNGAPVTVAALGIGTGLKYAHDTGLDKKVAANGAKIANQILKNVLHEDLDDSVLIHYGIKGMRWGVRKDRSPVDVTVKAKPGTRVKAEGGHNQPASEDAVTAARLHQMAKKSTTDSLSTKDLQLLVNRMNLERQFQSLEKEGVRDSKGKKAAKAFLKEGGKEFAGSVINDTVEEATLHAPTSGKKAKIAKYGIMLGAMLAKGAVANAAGGGKKKK